MKIRYDKDNKIIGYIYNSVDELFNHLDTMFKRENAIKKWKRKKKLTK